MSIVSSRDADFLSIAKLLADQPRLEAEYKRLQEARAQAEEVLKMVGPAKDVLRLREEARANSMHAAALAKQAEMDARVEVSKARMSAQTIVAAAEAEARELLTKAKADADAAKKALQDAQDAKQKAELEARAATARRELLDQEIASATSEKEKSEAAWDAAQVERGRLSRLADKFKRELSGE